MMQATPVMQVTPSYGMHYYHASCQTNQKINR